MNKQIMENIVVSQDNVCYENLDFQGKVTIGIGVRGTVFKSCRLIALEDAGD